MVTQTLRLGGSASDVVVGAVAHGLMTMTIGTQAYPDEQCFDSLKAGIDALPPGTKMFLNTGEFYDTKFGVGNLELLSRFFAKFPDYADKSFISVKGAMDWTKGVPPTVDGSMEFLRRSVDNCIRALGPNKSIDLYEPARIPDNVTLEELIQNLVTLKNEGKFSHIGLSECNAETIRKAHAIHPIAVVEIEISPWSYESRTQAVIDTTKELGITIAAYSPLGHGFLTGTIKRADDIDANDWRKHFSRFKEDALAHNLRIVDDIQALAKEKGVTAAQLCISWVKALGKDHILPLPGSSKASRTLENLEAGEIDLSTKDVENIKDILAKHGVQGDRYRGEGEDKGYLWK